MDNAEEKEDNQNEEGPLEFNSFMEVVNAYEDVKSKAIVKFCNIRVIKQHQHLECNTNLNKPPCNWMFKYSGGSALLHQALHESPCFTSFQIAHMFTSSVGEVDVVSDAENIKKLLKLPFQSNSVISMIVHKVGNTLLLDEFDVQRYMARRSKDDWKWLDKFFSAHILPLCENYHNFFFSDKSRAATKSRSLLSKFLYRSLHDDDVEISNKYPTTAFPNKQPLLPEPKTIDNVPQLVEQPHTFNRNVLWTFEDICMLIGTDMPIFGGPNRPCISLRLRDMSESINVLTGVDYWLDNLMCNVPEVVMCYHIDGIVQKYEIIKTEDLPFMEDSQFSPQVVHNVAQNILAFLKANATKAGHTYWLFKGRNDDVVKLYDLSTLSTLDNENGSASGSTETDNNNDEFKTNAPANPFTVPVAMLLYSVARNMKNNHERVTPKRAGAIRSLLENCIKLLDKEKYPQIVSSSHYILSELYIPEAIDPKDPIFDTTDDDSECWDDESFITDSDDDEHQSKQQHHQPDDEESSPSKQIDKSTEELLKRGVMVVKPFDDVFKEFNAESKPKLKKKLREPLPLIATTMERCRTSLKHISAGLSCLQFFDMNEERLVVESEARAKDEERQRIIHEEQNINMAKPFRPIPLPYTVQSDEPTSTLSSKTGGVTETNSQMCEKQIIEKAEKFYKVEKIRQQQMQTKEKLNDNYSHQNLGSWNVHLKLLFLEKASLVYATLAEHEYVSQNFGAALQYNIMAARCQSLVLQQINKPTSQKSALVARTGDCFLQIAKNFDNYKIYFTQFNDVLKLEQKLFDELVKELRENEQDKMYNLFENVEQLLLCSIFCYERAIEMDKMAKRNEKEAKRNDKEAFLIKSKRPPNKELYRRLGNAHNELGLKLMYWAQELSTASYNTEEYDKFLEDFKLEDKIIDYKLQENKENTVTLLGAVVPKTPYYLHLAEKSHDALVSSIKAFQIGEDYVNLAFLHCNLGRFFRFRAHLAKPDESEEEESSLEFQRKYYKEAFRSYQKALEVIEKRKKNPELWDIVQWECSTALFNLAKFLQDNGEYCGKNSLIESDKILLELLHKALSSCCADRPGPRQRQYILRTGQLHKRIGAFHYYRVCENWAMDAKFSLKLCQFHYKKAADIFGKLNEYPEGLAVMLGSVSVSEFLAENHTNHNAKFNCYNVAIISITNMCALDKIIRALQDKTIDDNGEVNSTLQAYVDGELFRLLSMIENRLQRILRDTLKFLQVTKDPRKLYDIYKQMYSETLKGRFQAGGQKSPPVTVFLEQIVDFFALLQSHNDKLKDIEFKRVIAKPDKQ